MCLSNGACLAQTILFVLNFLLSIVSLDVTGIGIFVFIQVKNVSDGELEYVNTTPIIVMVVGAIFSAIFFCGCCGALYKNSCLLITYSVITIVLASATVVFTVFVFKDVGQLKESAKDILMDTFSDPQNKVTLNILEAAIGCCGTTGPEYYNNSSIPLSCCPSALQNLQNLQYLQQESITGITNITSGDSLNQLCPISEAYEQGCVEVFTELLAKIFNITGHVLIWIIVIEYVAVVSAIFLTCYIRK